MNFGKLHRTCPKCDFQFAGVGDRSRCPRCHHCFDHPKTRTNFLKSDRTCPKCDTKFGAVADRCCCPQCGHLFNNSEVLTLNEEKEREANRKELARQWKNRPAADDMPSRAEFAGFEPQFSIEAAILAYQDSIATFPSMAWRTHDAMQLVALHHFGLFDGDVAKVAELAVDAAKQHLKIVDIEENETHGWFKPYANGLLAALLTGSKSSAIELSSLASLPREREYLPLIPWEIQILHQLFAAKLADNANAVESSLRSLAKSRRGRGKLYFEAFAGIEANDAETFQTRLVRALTLFAARKKPALNATYPTEWISATGSTLILLAKHLDVQAPTLPHHLDALLLTRKSLGLSEDA